MRLKDVVVIVTGAGRGIGRAIALRCAEEGASVVINDIAESALDGTAGKLKDAGAAFLPYAADVADVRQSEALVGAAVEAYGRVDVVVNNAGITRNNQFLELTEADFDEVIRVNLKGTFCVSQAAARQMVKQKSGRIINMSSRAYLGAQQMVNYAASKAGILGLTRCMALELGPSGITVNAVAPGTVNTELTRQMFKGFVTDRIAATPLRRIGEPVEIANVVVFLASPEASFITGEVIHVTGGFY